MDRPDLPLNALRVFEVAMRQGSFTKAAIKLRVTQAAVSHQVARLEDLLGTVLFLRTSQGLVPTDEGRLLFPVLGHGFDAMARVLDQLGGRRDIEVLNVGVNTTFALGWLMPRIPLFRQAHPGIDLRISTNNNRVEILREGLDMAIRFGTGGGGARGDSADRGPAGATLRPRADGAAVAPGRSGAGDVATQLSRRGMVAVVRRGGHRPPAADRPGLRQFGGACRTCRLRRGGGAAACDHVRKLVHEGSARAALLRHGIGRAILPRLAVGPAG